MLYLLIESNRKQGIKLHSQRYLRKGLGMNTADLIDTFIEELMKEIDQDITKKIQVMLDNLKNEIIQELDNKISNASNNLDSILTFKEVCSYLRISSSTMQRYLNRKDIIGYKSGLKWYFRKSDIDKYIESKLSESNI